MVDIDVEMISTYSSRPRLEEAQAWLAQSPRTNGEGPVISDVKLTGGFNCNYTTIDTTSTPLPRKIDREPTPDSF